MTIAVDFDGVLHSYDKGWHDGTIYGDWKPSAATALLLLMNSQPVFIHTTRSPKQVARWIEHQSGHGIECTTRLPRTWYGRRKPFWDERGVLLVTDRKLPAVAYIDDRAVRFESWEQTLNALGIEPVTPASIAAPATAVEPQPQELLRKPAYDTVRRILLELPRTPLTIAQRNEAIWCAVDAALNAMDVPGGSDPATIRTRLKDL